MTEDTPQPSGLFGVYLQAGDLDRSVSFYRDVLALEVVWNDRSCGSARKFPATGPPAWLYWYH